MEHKELKTVRDVILSFFPPTTEDDWFNVEAAIDHINALREPAPHTSTTPAAMLTDCGQPSNVPPPSAPAPAPDGRVPAEVKYHEHTESGLNSCYRAESFGIGEVEEAPRVLVCGFVDRRTHRETAIDGHFSLPVEENEGTDIGYGTWHEDRRGRRKGERRKGLEKHTQSFGRPPWWYVSCSPNHDPDTTGVCCLECSHESFFHPDYPRKIKMLPNGEDKRKADRRKKETPVDAKSTNVNNVNIKTGESQ